MKIYRILTVLLIAISMQIQAQESASSVVNTPEIKLSYLDSLKATFVHHEDLALIDSLWLKELTNNDLYEDMQEDILNVNPDDDVEYELSSAVIKERLARLNANSPFNIEYSKGLENTIKSYLKRRSKSYERLMAISEYYFPLFEEYSAKYNVPIEIKYLAVVESALNPRAKSRVGATGLWQFMYPTGKQFNLNVNSYVDERCDPIKATEAACQYLSSLYRMFGDWDLVLASYNAGPGNVTKAMRRSGNAKNYWNIRRKLPKETQNYVPAFLATMYMYEYAKEHGITAKKAPLTYFETDTVMVKRKISFNQISDLLDIPKEQLQLLNPIYKLDVIPYTADKPHYVRLPKNKISIYTSNEEAIYAYIDYEDSQREKPYFVTEREEAIAAAKDMEGKKLIEVTTNYTVRRGDNLGAIANKHDVTVSNLKKWNGIKGTMIHAGQRLKVNTYKVIDIPEEELAVEEKPIQKAIQQKPASIIKLEKPVLEVEIDVELPDATDIADEEGNEDDVADNYTKLKRPKEVNYEEERLYIVQKGDSLFSIARKHPGVTVENLMKWNKISGEKIKPGMKLSISNN